MIKLYTDVLVVGGGAAGLKAALTAADRGVQVILAVDYPYSGSTFYANSPEWGLTCARDEADVEALYQDIIHASHGCLNPVLARRMAEESRQGFEELKGYGLEFTNSKDIGMVSCFGKTARGGVLNDLNQAVDAYQEQIEARPKLKVVSGITAFYSGDEGRRLPGRDRLSKGRRDHSPLGFSYCSGLRRRGKPISVFLCGRALKRKRLRYGGPPWRENRKFGICPVHQRHAGAGRRTELLSRGVCRREKLYQPLGGAIFRKISSQGLHCGGMYEASQLPRPVFL